MLGAKVLKSRALGSSAASTPAHQRATVISGLAFLRQSSFSWKARGFRISFGRPTLRIPFGVVEYCFYPRNRRTKLTPQNGDHPRSLLRWSQPSLVRSNLVFALE